MADDWFTQSTVPVQQRPTPGPVAVGGTDPRLKGQTVKTDADAQAAAAVAPYAAPAAAADITAKQVGAARTQQQIDADNAAQTEEARKQRIAAISKNVQTSALMETLDRARRQVGAGRAAGNMWGGDFMRGVWGVGQNASDLSATLGGLKGKIINDTIAELKALSPSGASGYGSLSETEADRISAAVASIQQTQRPQELLESLATIERHYRRALAYSNEENPLEPEIAEKYGIIPEQTDDGEIPGARGRVTAEGNEEDDPALRGLNASVGRMIKNGRSEQEIRDYLNRVRPGMGDAVQNIGESIAYANQNPDRPVGVDIEKVWEPAGGISQTLGEIGMSPYGSAAIGAADVLTGGFLDNLTGNPDLTRATMQGVAEENPWSYFGGQLAGGAAAGLGGEALLAGRGLSGLGAARGADLLTGAAYGAGSSDEPGDSRVANALLGGGVGLGGGALGRAASRGVGTLVGGVNDDAVRALDQAGVRMTPGQIMGGVVKNFEDKMTSLPLVGNQIGARRMEGIDDFNRAIMRDAVAGIGAPPPSQIGQAGVNVNQRAVSDAYDAALGGQQFQADPQFTSDFAAALAGGRAIPQLGDQFDQVASQRVGSLFGPNGEITGAGFQDAIQGLRQARAATKNEVLGPEFGNSIGDIEDALRGLVGRQSPDVLLKFDAANAAYRNQSVVDDAVSRALSQGGTFMPSQLGQAARSNTVKFGGKQAAARGDMPFNEIQQAAQQVLPSKVPDSGTAGRAVIPALAFAAGGGGGYAAGEGDTTQRAGSGLTSATVAALLAAAPYSPAARNALQRVLVSERPAAFRKAGDIMVNQDTIAGLLAAPTSYLSLLGDK